MKKFLTVVLISFVSFNTYAADKIPFGSCKKYADIAAVAIGTKISGYDLSKIYVEESKDLEGQIYGKMLLDAHSQPNALDTKKQKMDFKNKYFIACIKTYK